jgi:DNA helicase-2/ATP-dependent DNA helicase PcrA
LIDRVLIYPTEKIKTYLITGDLKDIDTVRAKFYVALTRARYSVGIVCDFDDGTKFIKGVLKYKAAHLHLTNGNTAP